MTALGTPSMSDQKMEYSPEAKSLLNTMNYPAAKAMRNTRVDLEVTARPNTMFDLEEKARLSTTSDLGVMAVPKRIARLVGREQLD